jgi:hypothetical protein
MSRIDAMVPDGRMDHAADRSRLAVSMPSRDAGGARCFDRIRLERVARGPFEAALFDISSREGPRTTEERFVVTHVP